MSWTPLWGLDQQRNPVKQRFYLRPMAGWWDVVDRLTGRVISSPTERKEANDILREAEQLGRLPPNPRRTPSMPPAIHGTDRDGLASQDVIRESEPSLFRSVAPEDANG